MNWQSALTPPIPLQTNKGPMWILSVFYIVNYYMNNFLICVCVFFQERKTSMDLIIQLIYFHNPTLTPQTNLAQHLFFLVCVFPPLFLFWGVPSQHQYKAMYIGGPQITNRGKPHNIKYLRASSMSRVHYAVQTQ